MKKVNLFSSIATTLALAIAVYASQPSTASVTPEDALARIKQGNARFAEGRPEHPNQSPAHRAEVAKKQTPHTVVVTCSDSRLSPELIFDQGIGDLFVVRTAGNTLDAENMGSVEYSTAVLGSKLVVVMGHDKCGAVDAAMKGEKLPTANLEAVVKPIKGAIGAGKQTLDEAISKNVKAVESMLKTKNKLTADMVKSGQIKVVGAVYDMSSGSVRFLN